MASDVSTRELLSQKSLNEGNDVKKKLFDELILTTMKKYYLGSDIGNPDLSGIDYICAFVNGDIRAVTRDNNLRERVMKIGLNNDDISRIIENSAVANTEYALDNYIKMVMLNEMIRCSYERFPGRGNVAVNEYIYTGRSISITNSVGRARILTKTLRPEDINDLFQSLGVTNLDEYIKYYYKNDKMRYERR